MKYPKNWNKMDNEAQRKWAAEKLAKVRAEENALVKLLRALVQDGKFVSRVDERPDLVNLKHD